MQEQAQQIEAEIRRLEELKTDTKRVDADASFYFTQPRQRPEGIQAGVDLERDFEKLPELYMQDEGKAAAKDARVKLQDQARGRPEQRRGELRKQAAEQLERLQTMQQEEPGRQKKAAPQQSALLPAEKHEAATGGLGAVDERAGEQAPQAEQAAPGTPEAAVGTGPLSLDWDVAPVGTAHHFRKLHGEPRLVLRARHESLGRSLSAIVWAGLCLALATAVIQGLRRPGAAALAYRLWPWLAAVAGTAWLFLLPAGVFGLALLVTALCVLIARWQKRPTTDSEKSFVEQGIS